MIKQEFPVIVCNVCKKEIQTNSFSQNYEIGQLTLANFRQSGSGSSPYQLDRPIKGDACLECFTKMKKESPTFQAFLHSMK